MAPRLDLQGILEGILGSDHVYFQPPPSIKMEYPCIVYSRYSALSQFAGNILYKRDKRYTITVIDRNPDSDIPDKVAELPKCAYDRYFVTEGLHHDVFNVYF